MARIDYTGILLATRDVLANDTNIRAARATVELMRSVVLDSMSPHINIVEGRREPTQQVIAGGTIQWYNFSWQVWVSCFSADGLADASRQRDDLIGHVETAMMANRNLGGKLPNKNLWLMGGLLHSEKGDTGFWATGTVDLRVEIKATTT